jgi:hypothetical protein
MNISSWSVFDELSMTSSLHLFPKLCSFLSKGRIVSIIHACFLASLYLGYGLLVWQLASGYPRYFATTHFVPLMPPFAKPHSTAASSIWAFSASLVLPEIERS